MKGRIIYAKKLSGQMLLYRVVNFIRSADPNGRKLKSGPSTVSTTLKMALSYFRRPLKARVLTSS